MNFFRLFIAIAVALQIACHAASSTVPVVIITVTNAPSDGQKVTINGNDRTAKTSVVTPATQFAIGASTNLTAASLWTQLQAYSISGISTHNHGAQVYLIGSQAASITASITGTWASILNTNWPLANFTVIVPFTVYDSSKRMMMGNFLIDAISIYPTNRVSATAPAFLNYFSLSQANVASGSNVFTSSNLFQGITIITNVASMFANGIISNAYMTNMQSLGVTNAFIANMQVGNLTLSNGAPGLFFNEFDAALNEKYTFLQQSTVGGVAGLRLTYFNDALNSASTHLRATRSGNSPLLFEVFSPFFANFITNTILTNCVAGFTSGVANGVQVTNVVGLHGALMKLAGGYLDGVGATNLISTNGTFAGNNAITGAFGTTETVNATLANGNNAALNFGTTSFVTLNAGPTLAFNINGIVAGFNGQEITIYNHTGQDMTIVNDSGVDPTPANRIYTMTAAPNITTTGDGSITLKYSSSAARWIVKNSQL